MRNSSGHQGENARVKNSEQQQVRHILHKTCNYVFLRVSRCGRTKQRQRNVQKKCAAHAKLLFFLLIRPIVVFHRSRCLRRLA